MALIGTRIANSFWLLRRHAHSVDMHVEWVYAFDIHMNAFFPVFVLLSVVQYMLLPVLLQPGVLSLLLGNTLYLVAFSYYSYVSFLGYVFLPFLNKDKVRAILYAVVGLVACWVLFLVLNVNVARLCLDLFY